MYENIGVSMKTKVLLGGGRYQTQITKDGTFELCVSLVGSGCRVFIVDEFA